MSKPCPNCQKSFEIPEEDKAFYKKIDVPEPTWCPPCRHLRRHAHINDYVYYTRTCDNCQNPFVSSFPQKTDYIVFCQTCWYAEERDDRAAARDYDPHRSFFEQFDELMHEAPQLGLTGIYNENCDFCESVANCRNCYLISESSNLEDCYYGYWLQKSDDCLECNYVHACERCYEITDCVNCYNLRYSQNCRDCSDSAFLEGCIGCRNCLYSTNLRQREFYIFNKPYSREDYFKEFKKINFGDSKSIASINQKFLEFLKTEPRKNLQIEHTENCTGDHIRNAKNCKQVFHCYDAEECSYGEHVWRNAKYCMDSSTAGRNAELLYETVCSGINSYNVKFSRYCWGSSDTEYSNQSINSKNLFGCVGLKAGARYCVLNKQYSKEEYEALVEKIKEKMREDGEYGELFPMEMSLFGYNNTVSFDEFPFSREEALSRGWKWEDTDWGMKGKGTIEMGKIPSNIKEIDKSILDEILTCQNCERNYKIIRKELKFYQSQNIPPPLNCPDCRHRTRLALRPSKIMHDIKCAECGEPTKTTLDPQKFSKILCNGCYKKLVY